MKKIILILAFLMGASAVSAQQILSPELLWKLGRVSALGISKDGKNVIYKVSVPSLEENKSDSKFYSISVNGGFSTEISETKELLIDKNYATKTSFIVKIFISIKKKQKLIIKI